MSQEDFIKVFTGLYARCGITPLLLTYKSHPKDKYTIMYFRHPTKRKIIEVTANTTELKLVLVYGDTTNAHQRNAIECKNIEQFRKAIA